MANFLTVFFNRQVTHCGRNNTAYLLASDLLGQSPSPATHPPPPQPRGPPVRAVKVLFDSVHLAAVGKILKGVKKDSINLIDKVEPVCPLHK